MKIDRWKITKTHDTIMANLTQSDQSRLKLLRHHLLWTWTVNLHNHIVKINKWKLNFAFDNDEKKLLVFFFLLNDFAFDNDEKKLLVFFLLTLDHFSSRHGNFSPRVNDFCNSGSSENPGLFGKELKGE